MPPSVTVKIIINVLFLQDRSKSKRNSLQKNRAALLFLSFHYLLLDVHPIGTKIIPNKCKVSFKIKILAKLNMSLFFFEHEKQKLQ